MVRLFIVACVVCEILYEATPTKLNKRSWCKGGGGAFYVYAYGQADSAANSFKTFCKLATVYKHLLAVTLGSALEGCKFGSAKNWSGQNRTGCTGSGAYAANNRQCSCASCVHYRPVHALQHILQIELLGLGVRCWF